MPRVIEQEDRFDDPVMSDFKKFIMLKKQIEELTKMQSAIKARLVDVVDKYGEADDKGHLWYDLPESFEGYSGMQHQKRVSQKVNMDAALEVIENSGLTDRCVHMVPSIDEDEVAACVFEGLISEDELDEMFPKVVTWAFVPKKA